MNIQCLWDQYNATVEARLVQDVMKLQSEQPKEDITFYLYPALEAQHMGAAQSVLNRLGVQCYTTICPPKDRGAIFYYVHRDNIDLPPDLRDGACEVFYRRERPVKNLMKLGDVDRTPVRRPNLPEQDPIPPFKSFIPQGTPTTFLPGYDNTYTGAVPNGGANRV